MVCMSGYADDLLVVLVGVEDRLDEIVEVDLVVLVEIVETVRDLGSIDYVLGCA
jgi:hypothetical protein